MLLRSGLGACCLTILIFLSILNVLRVRCAHATPTFPSLKVKVYNVKVKVYNVKVKVYNVKVKVYNVKVKIYNVKVKVYNVTGVFKAMSAFKNPIVCKFT